MTFILNVVTSAEESPSYHWGGAPLEPSWFKLVSESLGGAITAAAHHGEWLCGIFDVVFRVRTILRRSREKRPALDVLAC